MIGPPNDTDNTVWTGRQKLPPRYVELRHQGEVISSVQAIDTMSPFKTWESLRAGGLDWGLPIYSGGYKITWGSSGIR